MSVSTSKRASVGEILVRRKLLNRVDLDRALQAQRKLLLPLASTVYRLGLVEEMSLVLALAEHFGVPGVDLGASVIDTEVLAMIPREVARSHHVLPLATSADSMLTAIANPDQRAVLDEIAFATGRAALPYVALQIRIDETIEAAYEARKGGGTLWKGPRASGEAPHTEILKPEQAHDSVSLDVHLPEEPLLADAAQREVRPPGAKPRALVVDDEESILDIIDKALSLRGIDVARASRGREALEKLKEHNPDIVLLDAMLPEIHGFELCSKIKGSERYRHVPVIIISAVYTGWNFAQDVKRIYGADDYIGKPFRVVELVRRVEEALQKVHARPKPADLDQAGKVCARECKKAAELYQLGQLEEALAAAQRAINADPFDGRAHFMLGTVLNAMGHIFQAISEYERVVEISPSMFSALKNLAVLYERQGFKAKAVEMWTRALEQSPSEAVRQTIKAHLIGLL